MIYDRLENMPQYFNTNADIIRAYKFLKSLDIEDIGRHVLGEDGMYANVEKYITQPEEDRRAEAHRRFIDVQFILHGQERIGYAPLSEMKEAEPFSEKNDIGFYEGECKTWLSMFPGDFAVIFPHEGHLPCTTLHKPCEVVKAVVKIPVK
jgi:YhcH/YjgK/YiaL family protein